MSERIVVLRSEQPMRFLVDDCAALADAVNEPRAWRSSDAELLTVYAEAVSALARLGRAQLAEGSGAEVGIAVIDHLLEHLRQTRDGEMQMPLADVIDRLPTNVLRLNGGPVAVLPERDRVSVIRG